MHQPPTPNINIEDTSATTTVPTPNPLSTTRTNVTRPRSTASSESRIYEEQPWRQPSIRIRRLPSTPAGTRARAASVATPGFFDGPHVTGPPTRVVGSDVGTAQFLTPNLGVGPGRAVDGSGSGGNRHLRHENRSLAAEGLAPPTRRNRAASDPPQMRRESNIEGGGGHMPCLEEGVATTPLPTPGQPPNLGLQAPDAGQVAGNGNLGLARRLSNAAGQTYSRFFPTLGAASTAPADLRDEEEQQYESEMVDVLDTVDPEISTLNTLTNVQNSLFVPDLGRYLNRRPTYTLTRHPTERTYAEAAPPIREEERVEEEEAEAGAVAPSRPGVQRTYTLASITSHLDESHFAVLPHGETLHGWTAEDRAELNDHVRHLMHSRKEKFKRSMKGFGQYVRKPLGFFVTLYGTLITLFGLAWVLFLIGWINVGGRKDYIVNVIDNVLVALFAVVGDGLAPFRIVDTYHMCFIAHYHHLTWRLRREQALPKLQNRNDLPGLGPTWDQQPTDADAELGTKENEKGPEYSVLSPAQQRRLVHHQKKFSRSHTFYKPHETSTHFAFPLQLLVAIVVLLDCHSLLQIALGSCTWAISYHHRPFALTTVILCCSITCNITAGVVITVGDHKTRKKDVLERMFRQELTAQAMNKLEKKKEKERQRNDLSDLTSTDASTTAVMEKIDNGDSTQAEDSTGAPETSEMR